MKVWGNAFELLYPFWKSLTRTPGDTQSSTCCAHLLSKRLILTLTLKNKTVKPLSISKVSSLTGDRLGVGWFNNVRACLWISLRSLQLQILNKDVTQPLLHYEFKNNLFRGDYDVRCSRKRRYDFSFYFL